MRAMNKAFWAALAFQPLTLAAISKTCPNPADGICFSLNIPDQTASSGLGDIFFQITAPTIYEWVALGQGTRMANSNIFIMYTSSSGQNITVSPRRGTGHTEPSHEDSTARITLLAGSEVSADGQKMTANIRCSNCNTWQGGTMDFTSPGGSWIHASKTGIPIKSDDLNADINFHDDHGVFNWDFAAAKGSVENEVNPFLASTVPVTTATNTSTPSTAFKLPSHLAEIKKAHGSLASIAFILLFPTGSILIRLSYPLLLHRIIQLFALILFTAALGMGAWMTHNLSLTSEKHIMIGIIVYILVFFQPIWGSMHHRNWQRTQARGVWSQLHIWLGRSAIVLGLVNGGLGLQLSGHYEDVDGAKIAYGVLAAIFGLAYLASIVVGERRRSRDGRERMSGSEEQEMEVVHSAVDGK